MIQFGAKKRLGKKTMKNSEGVAIAVIQLNSSFDVSRSLKALDLQLQKITPGEVAAIFLPENFAALAAPSPLAIGQSEAGGKGPIRDYLKQQSRSLEAYIFAGTLPLAVRPDGQPVPEGRVRAASFVLDPGGREVARYDKKHLFDVFVEDGQGQYLESATFEPGQALCVSETTFGAVGLRARSANPHGHQGVTPPIIRPRVDPGAQVVSEAKAEEAKEAEACWRERSQCGVIIGISSENDGDAVKISTPRSSPLRPSGAKSVELPSSQRIVW